MGRKKSMPMRYVLLAAIILATPALAAGPSIVAVHHVHGTIAAQNGTVTVPVLPDDATLECQLTGTWTGTATFQTTSDTVPTYITVAAARASVSSTTVNGNFLFRTAGLTALRVNSTAVQTGSIVVDCQPSTGTPPDSAAITGTVSISNPVTTTVADTSSSATLSTTCASTTACAATASVQVAMAGQNAAELNISAVASPVGITLACDASHDGGTTYVLAQCFFGYVGAGTQGKHLNTLGNADMAVNQTYVAEWTGAATHIRFRVVTLTSGTVTAIARATANSRSIAPPIGVFTGTINSAPIGAGTNPAGYVVGGVDQNSLSIFRPLHMSNNNASAPGSGAIVHTAIAKAGPTAVTAGNSEMQEVDNVSGGTYVTESPTTNNVATSVAVVSVNTATNVKASAGNVYGIAASNAAATPCFLQFYNTAGSPTCGTSVVWSVPLPPTPGVYVQPVGPIPLGNFATGIGVCVSTTPTGGVTCGSTVNGVTIFYK